MKHHYVGFIDSLGKPHVEEFPSKIEAEAYAECTDQVYFAQTDNIINLKKEQIEKAVKDYLNKRTKHIRI